MEFVHKPVLLRECMEALHIRRTERIWTAPWAAPAMPEQIVRRLTTGRSRRGQDETALCARRGAAAPYLGRVTLSGTISGT